MIKPPGAFSQKYKSNPVRSRLSREHNKENTSLNGTFDGCELDLTNVLPQTKTPIKRST